MKALLAYNNNLKTCGQRADAFTVGPRDSDAVEEARSVAAADVRGFLGVARSAEHDRGEEKVTKSVLKPHVESLKLQFGSRKAPPLLLQHLSKMIEPE